MTYSADFVVLGDPQPKGSWKSFVSLVVKVRKLYDVCLRAVDCGPEDFKRHWRDIQRCFKAIMKPDADRSKDWERQVRLVASRYAPAVPIDAPMGIEFYFSLKKPLKPRWWCPAVAPDWDKLARSTGDAMTGVIYVDDSRVVRAVVTKEYGRPGVRIVIRTLSGQEELFDGDGEATEAV